MTRKFRFFSLKAAAGAALVLGVGATSIQASAIFDLWWTPLYPGAGFAAADFSQFGRFGREFQGYDEKTDSIVGVDFGETDPLLQTIGSDRIVGFAMVYRETVHGKNEGSQYSHIVPVKGKMSLSMKIDMEDREYDYDDKDYYDVGTVEYRIKYSLQGKQTGPDSTKYSFKLSGDLDDYYHVQGVKDEHEWDGPAIPTAGHAKVGKAKATFETGARGVDLVPAMFDFSVHPLNRELTSYQGQNVLVAGEIWDGEPSKDGHIQVLEGGKTEAKIKFAEVDKLGSLSISHKMNGFRASSKGDHYVRNTHVYGFDDVYDEFRPQKNSFRGPGISIQAEMEGIGSLPSK